MGYIYLRTNKINGKQYVGQTTDLKVRENVWNNFSHHYAGKAIDAARAKYGIDAFDFEILKECKDEELNQWEMYYIKELNTKVPNGYNMTDGGEGRNGSSVSEETKKKISETLKGNIPWNKGKTNIYSEETKKKISESKKGIPILKLSKSVLQIDKNTNEVIAEFPSLHQVTREIGFDIRNISACCLGKRKSSYGYKWQYK